MDDKIAIVASHEHSVHLDPHTIIGEFVKSDLSSASVASPRPKSSTASEYGLIAESDDFEPGNGVHGNGETDISPPPLCSSTPDLKQPFGHAFNGCEQGTPHSCPPTPYIFDHPVHMMIPRSYSPRRSIVSPVPSLVALTPGGPRKVEVFNYNEIQTLNFVDTPSRRFKYRGCSLASKTSPSVPSAVLAVPPTPTNHTRRANVLTKREYSRTDEVGGEGHKSGKCSELEQSRNHDSGHKVCRLLWKKDEEKKSLGNDPFL